MMQAERMTAWLAWESPDVAVVVEPMNLWRGAAGPLRDRYIAAWDEATRFEAIGDLDPDVFARATDAWDALKEHVIGRRS